MLLLQTLSYNRHMPYESSQVCGFRALLKPGGNSVLSSASHLKLSPFYPLISASLEVKAINKSQNV